MANELTTTANGKIVTLTGAQAERLYELSESEDLATVATDSALASMGLAESLDEGVHSLSAAGERLLGAAAYLAQKWDPR